MSVVALAPCRNCGRQSGLASIDGLCLECTGTEARYTEPSPYCPHPERWHARDGDSAEVEVSDLAYGLVRALQPELCLETGTAYGQTARRIGEALRDNGHGSLVTIERDELRAALAAAELVGLPVHVEHADSLASRLNLEAEILPLGFAWLDSHSDLRVAEYWHFRPWMRPGSLVCFHDTAPGHGSPGRELRAELERELTGKVRLLHLPTPRGLTLAEVL